MWLSSDELRFTVGSYSGSKGRNDFPLVTTGRRGTHLKNDFVKFHSVRVADTLRVGHLLRLDQLIEFVACQIAQLHSCLPQTRMFYVGGMRDLGGLVIADLRG